MCSRSKPHIFLLVSTTYWSNLHRSSVYRKYKQSAKYFFKILSVFLIFSASWQKSKNSLQKTLAAFGFISQFIGTESLCSQCKITSNM